MPNPALLDPIVAKSPSPSPDAAVPKRVWELDVFRGFAILTMISFHFLFDLKHFGIHPAIQGVSEWPEAFFDAYSTFVASSFLTLVGVSASLRSVRLGSRKLEVFLRPASRVFAGAAAVTVISLIFYSRWPIYFGILHCIATSLLLMPVLLRFGKWNAPLGVAMILLGDWMNHQPVPFPWLTWLGLKPSPYPMGDYFSLLPWTGVIALGIAAERWLDLAGRAHWLPSAWARYRAARALGFLGRHSLMIYLIHQPIVLGLAALCGLIEFPS